MTRETLIKIIRDHLGGAPDSSLAASLAEQCRALPEDSTMPEVLTFLRDLYDQIVYIGGANGFTMTAIRDVMLEGHPETDAERDARQAALAKRLGVMA